MTGAAIAGRLLAEQGHAQFLGAFAQPTTRRRAQQERVRQSIPARQQLRNSFKMPWINIFH
jgi:hypothetical protein